MRESQDRRPERRPFLGSTGAVCLVVYLAAVVAMLLVVLHRNNGIFVYALEDTYIHLALAQSLAHGHYGINPGEAASPSSSIAWPFLLAPLANTRVGVYFPLILNVLCGAFSAWLLGWVIDDLAANTPETGEVHNPLAGRLASSQGTRIVLAICLMLVANLVGLTFVGMEHGLQVALAIASAAGMLRAFTGRRIPDWSLVATGLGPLVRYENLLLVIAMAAVLKQIGRARAALALVCVSIAGPLLFSAFLMSRGLPPLPASVMVKGLSYSGSVHQSITYVLTRGISGGLFEGAWWALLALEFVLGWLILSEKNALRRSVLEGAFLVGALQLIVGHVSWFHRYEVYAVVFIVLIALAALIRSTALPRPALVAMLLLVAAPYLLAIRDTPTATHDIYLQQYQMHRFIAGYRGTVGVNDLGLVSFDRPADVRVLDFWGLASPEAATQRNKSSQWLETMVNKHDAGLAIIFPEWYSGGAPSDWIPLARLCTAERMVTMSRPCVMFYSTPKGDPATLERQLREFGRTLPPGDSLQQREQLAVSN